MTCTEKPATRARKLSAIKSILSFACDYGILKTNVARRVKAPKIRDELAERILSESEVSRMISLETDPRIFRRNERSFLRLRSLVNKKM